MPVAPRNICGGLESARTVAEMIRRGVENLGLANEANVGGLPGVITVSIGLADASLSDKDAMEVVRRADPALYRAKGHGRNRVEDRP